ncbi:hypothetical protein AC578_8715 [Pseudocercospora eumusae]|uniref:Uncharacterized protein n=1 Tax=Pseudocercospora eumusae TaxID=321146 RepID=A0A139HPW7_9PEZI|nr:hypothetical protein AC578_8715 [Pseudocercospora eumusae]
MAFTPSLLFFVLLTSALTAFVFIVGSLTDLDAPEDSTSVASIKDQEELDQIPLPIRKKILALPAEKIDAMLIKVFGNRQQQQQQLLLQKQIDQQQLDDVSQKEEVSRRRGSDIQSVLEEFRGLGLDCDLSSFAVTL